MKKNFTFINLGMAIIAAILMALIAIWAYRAGIAHAISTAEVTSVNKDVTRIWVAITVDGEINEYVYDQTYHHSGGYEEYTMSFGECVSQVLQDNCPSGIDQSYYNTLAKNLNHWGTELPGNIWAGTKIKLPTFYLY